MDTIIYFYKKRDLHQPIIDSLQMRDYLLVRVGMNVGEGKWFAHAFTGADTTSTERSFWTVESQEPKERQKALTERRNGQKRVLFLHSLRDRLWQRRERRAEIRFQRQQQRKLQEIQSQVRVEIQGFLEELSLTVDNRYECRCVYADAVGKYLKFPENSSENYWLPRLWHHYWQFPEFDDFLQIQWVEPLLKKAEHHHFVVLGTAGCVPFAIRHCAQRMKSLRWLLREEDYSQELQDFVEDFYGEYGLAAAVQTLEGEKVFARLLLETREPVCVLDFTGEPRIPANGLARGSIWLDFCSVEEKARRILEREEGIRYISMKEIWKEAGKP